MMAETIRYYVFPQGGTTEGRRGTIFKKRALAKFRRGLRTHCTPLFHFREHPENEMTLGDLMSRVEKMLDAPHQKTKRITARGSKYDESGMVLVEVVTHIQVTDPMVKYLAQYVGKSSYDLGANGPPGPSDCSGTTSKAAKTCHNVDLPHSANEQGHDPDAFNYFFDVDELKSGDFIFYKYTDRVGSSPDDYDHVDIFVEPGLSIGSRPSTNGIGYYHWLNGAAGDKPDWAALKYGRLGTP